MNLAAIVKHVAEMTPEAKHVRAQGVRGGVQTLVCEIGGKMRAVQFTDQGLYGDPVSVLGVVSWTMKSDLHIAAEIAKELRT